MTAHGNASRSVHDLRRVPAVVLIVLVRIYQASFSRFLGGQCRFVPTCSEYFIESVQKHGAIRGGARGLWRILRCHPFSKDGYDPVR